MRSAIPHSPASEDIEGRKACEFHRTLFEKAGWPRESSPQRLDPGRQISRSLPKGELPTRPDFDRCCRAVPERCVGALHPAVATSARKDFAALLRLPCAG